ncbi:MAG: protein kinase [Candidatus Binatus sp.]
MADTRLPELFGDRWEVVRPLNGGGQSHVYIVRDRLAQQVGDLVLKHIDNSRDNRDERFRNEVEAAMRLNHPNIMRVIDHSDFSRAGSDEPMYLVMPFAAAGSLTKRAALYKDQIDPTITVAKALAAALAHAHKNGVIHRDHKPDNILFAAEDHHPLLADFGICLIQGAARFTGDAEIVGPRSFMAPELEDGGKLNVTPAADLYSLGKVIYFMISGGRIFARERHREPDYDLSHTSVRHAQIWLLLDRLICPVADRYSRAEEVIDRLEKIEGFGKSAAVPLGDGAKARLRGMVTADAAHNAAIQKHQEDERRKEAAFESFVQDVAATTNAALKSFAEEIGQEGYITATAIDAAPAAGVPNGWDAAWGAHRKIKPLWVASIKVNRVAAMPPEHFLSVFLAIELKTIVRAVETGKPLPLVSHVPDDAILFPIYFRGPEWGFLVQHQATQVRRTFAGVQPAMFLNLRPSEWPADGDKVRKLLQGSVELFVEYLAAQGPILGG